MARFNTTQTFLHGQQQVVVHRREWLSGFVIWVIVVTMAVIGGLAILYETYQAGAHSRTSIVIATSTPIPPRGGGSKKGTVRRPTPPPAPPAPTVIKVEVEPIQVQVQVTAPLPPPSTVSLPPNKW